MPAPRQPADTRRDKMPSTNFVGIFGPDGKKLTAEEEAALSNDK